FSGQPTSVSWTVTNSGNGATSASSWYDSVYLSLDPTLDGTDILLASVQNPAYLAPNSSYSSNASFTLPQGINGPYYLIVKADAGNQVVEFQHEGDNVAASTVVPVQLTPPPDLQVTHVQAPAQAFSGQPLALTWTVKNEGSGATGATAWSD